MFALFFQEFLALILGILIGLYAVLHALHGELGIPFIVMIVTSLYLVAWLNPRTRLKQTYKQAGGGCEETLEVDETQILLQGANWKSEFLWPAVSSFSEDEKTFLLDLAPGKSIVIPKRLCSSDRIDELRALFTAQIKPSSQP